jgi:hypothetical protein
LSLDRTIGPFIGFLRVLTGFQPVAGAKCSELQSARKIATCGVWREPRRKSLAEICQIAGLDESIGGQNLCNPAQLFMADRLGRPGLVDDASAVDLCHLSLAAARGFQPVLRHRQLTL